MLSHNRKTPNMVLTDGWESEQLDVLLGELVYLKVETDSFTIRKATLDEAEAFWFENETADSGDFRNGRNNIWNNRFGSG